MQYPVDFQERREKEIEAIRNLITFLSETRVEYRKEEREALREMEI